MSRRLALIGVILVAFFFRFYRLADHPLGLFFDPAINGLDAVRLIQRGGAVIFFPTNGGREAFFIYLLIPFIRLFGTTPFSVRLLTAIISLLNVAWLVGFLADRTVFAHSPLRRDKRSFPPIDKTGGIPCLLSPVSCLLSFRGDSRFWLALLAGLVMAVLPWHIAVSRLGQRPILVPMLAVPLVWFFLRGWKGNRPGWFILAGLCLGLAGHTYSAARLLPLILGLALLPELPRLKSRLVNLLLMGLTALVVYLPLAWYLLRHPAQFTERAFSVMVWNFLDSPAEIMAEIGRNIGRVIGFFGWVGSPNPIFGLPGYPGLPLLLALFLWLGLIVAIRRWRDLFHRLVALWWLIGAFAAATAIEAPHPLRMIVALPPTAILTALGLMTAAGWPGRKIGLPARPFYRLACLLILLPAPAFYTAFFVRWPALPVTQGVYDYGAVAIREAVLAQSRAGDRPIYLPLSRFNDSTLLFYLSGHFQRRAALTAPPAETALVIAPDRMAGEAVWVRLHRGEATLLPPLEAEGRRLIRAALEGEEARPIRTGRGETVARLVSLPVDPVRYGQQPTHPLTVTLGPARLTGASYDWEIDPAAAGLPVTLYWQADQSMRREYERLLHLVDDRQQALSVADRQANSWAYPTSFWRPGLDKIADRHTLTLPAEPLPPGRYWLAAALYDPAAGHRFPLKTGEGDTYLIGPLKVSLPPQPLPAAARLDEPVTFGNTIQLVGFRADSLRDSPLAFTLIWQALARPDRDYTVFVHLLDAAGEIAAGRDSPPRQGGYPTTIWSPGERIPDTHTLPLPDDLPPGTYRLATGLYHQPSGERLPLRLPTGEYDPQGRLILPPVIVIDPR